MKVRWIEFVVYAAMFPSQWGVASDVEDSPELAAEIDVLIEELGHPEFSSRELASERLVEIGAQALPALDQGRRHADREVRLRCERILARVRVETRRRQLARFLSHQDSASTNMLPGWTRFVELVGDTTESRKLFGEMLEAEWDLLENLNALPAAASEAMLQRCTEVQNARSYYRQTASLPTVASLLLVASDEQINVSDEIGRQLYFLCVQVPSFRNALQARDNRSNQPLRRLTGAWIRRAAGTMTASYCVPLALRYYLPEGVELAQTVLRGNHKAQVRQNAILLLAKMGERSHIEFLESLLDDRSECIRRTEPKTKKTVVTQVRDVALAAMIHLVGKDPKKDFDFAFARTNDYSVFVPHSLGFADEKSREHARKKWDQFKYQMQRAARQNEG